MSAVRDQIAACCKRLRLRRKRDKEERVYVFESALEDTEILEEDDSDDLP